MTPERVAKITAVLNNRQPDLTVITDQINKAQNISAILRSCDAFGVFDLHTVEPYGNFKLHHRTAGGAGEWVRQHHYQTTEEAIKTCKAQGMKIYAAHLSDKAIPYTQIDFTQPCAIVMGAEKRGIGEYAEEHADEHIIIPMSGMVESFNVSVAAAIILNEAYQQRANKGMYDGQRRISDEDFYHALFRCCHPRLAQHCDDNGISYPPIGDDGHLIEPSKWYEQQRQQDPLSQD